MSPGKSCGLCCGCFVRAPAPFFVLLRRFLSMAKRKSGRGICVSSGFGCFFCVACFDLPVFRETTAFPAEVIN